MERNKRTKIIMLILVILLSLIALIFLIDGNKFLSGDIKKLTFEEK